MIRLLSSRPAAVAERAVQLAHASDKKNYRVEE